MNPALVGIIGSSVQPFLTFVGLNAAASSSANLPAFQVGDLAVVYAFRDGSTTIPSLPTGWTNISGQSGVNFARRAGFRVLELSDTTTSAWTNATELQVIVLRGQHGVDPIGGVANRIGDDNQLIYNALSPESSTFWVLGFGAHRSATNVNARDVSGMTRRSGSIGTLGCHTAENISSFSQTSWTSTVNASSDWDTFVIEIKSAA